MSSLLLLPSMSFSYALLLLLPLSMDGANFQIPGSKGFVIKMIPPFSSKNRSQGSKGDKNLLGFLLSFVNQLILHAINWTF